MWFSASILLLKHLSSPQKKMPKVCNIVGGVVSPILANVYLHELDEFVEELRQGLEKGEAKHRDPTYRKISKEKARMAARGETRTKEFKAIEKIQ